MPLQEINMKKVRNFAGIALLALTVCATGEKALAPAVAHARIEARPAVVNVVARDYRFDMPDSVPGGPIRFHFTNDGKQLHHMTLVKLGHGKTLADFTALPPGPFPSWAVLVGGPNAPLPAGGHDDVVVDLSPGNYAVICLIPGPDGKPHMMNGMVKALTVTPSTRARTMPATDLTLTLTNYAFAFSTPPTPGRHAIRVINHGTQPHEAELFRLEAGKRGEDIAKWVETGMQGPPPGAPVAGVAPMVPGKQNTLLLNLSPGRYALLCFMPDAKDGKAHASHGMIYNFKVG